MGVFDAISTGLKHVSFTHNSAEIKIKILIEMWTLQEKDAPMDLLQIKFLLGSTCCTFL